RRVTPPTIDLRGPEELGAGAAIRPIASAVGPTVAVVRAPVFFPPVTGGHFDATTTVPLVAASQVRILSESVTEPLPFADPPPPDLAPMTMFSVERIRAELPAAGAFSVRDLRLFQH